MRFYSFSDIYQYFIDQRKLRGKSSKTKMNTKTKTILTNIQITLNLINHIFVFVIGFYMTYVLYKVGGSLIGWHAWCCAIGVSFSIYEFVFSEKD